MRRGVGEGVSAAAAAGAAAERDERTRGLLRLELRIWVRLMVGATTDDDEEDEVEAGVEAGRVWGGGNAAAVAVEGGTTTGASRWRFALRSLVEKEAVAILCAAGGGCPISQVGGSGRFLRLVVVVMVATVSVRTGT